MRTTAEGIETPEQSELLSKSGCDVLQGYVFGRPADLGDVGFSEQPMRLDHLLRSNNRFPLLLLDNTAKSKI
ncbi:EAL domain-containing protein [Roseobacter sp. A03A-229]